MAEPVEEQYGEPGVFEQEVRVTDGSDDAQPDLEIPNPARMYDYYLGGATNFAADRELAEKVLSRVPEFRIGARHNRSFLRRVVTYLVDQGIDQFLDIGSGIPTVGNVHEIAHDAKPAARIVYVDHDPVAVAHSEQILDGNPLVRVVRADMRDPDAVLNAAATRELLDLRRPVGLLMVAVLHFVPDAERPLDMLARYRAALVPGSHLALSHFTLDAQPARVSDAVALYQNTSDPVVTRTREEFAALFDGFDLVEPGVVWAALWHPDEDTDGEPPERGMCLAGMGRLT